MMSSSRPPSAALARRAAAFCAAAALALGIAGASGVQAAESSVLVAYSLAAPRAEVPSGIVVRAVVAQGANCPSLDIVDSTGAERSLAMRVRSAPASTQPAFDALTVCSAPVPPGTSSASVQGRGVPSRMPEQVDRLALLGDSGCRINGTWVQDCTDPSTWPLARIAASIAKERPDAIIFNGDFYYRESPCPAANQSWCGSSPPPVQGMPFTDSAYGWLADALVPMAPMFAAAPIIVTRGNHEACYRGGNGYFLFFDPREGTEDTCAPSLVNGVLTAAPTVPTATYAIDLAMANGRTLRLAIVDSAGGNDTAVSPYAAVQRPAYERAAQLTRPMKGRESWLLTHRPLYAYVTSDYAVPGTPFNPWGSADQAAAAWGTLDSYSLVFSSHLHQAMVVQLPGLPPQLVLGNAGTYLDPPTGYALPTAGEPAGEGRVYPVPTWAWVAARFGYAMAEPGAEIGTWRMQMQDPSGRTFARCGLRDRSMYCR